MGEELPLGGGATTDGIVRVGDTVRRPRGRTAKLMREVLVHLQQCGFEAAPRWLGVDHQGRDILSWIDGETFARREQLHPYIGDPPVRVSFSDEQLVAVMRLLRRYHDTFERGIICHGDFGPWNIVWRAGLPVGMIDFDNVHRGDPEEDVACALRTFLSYGLASAAPEELVRRTRVALGAYGREFDVVAILDHEYELVGERCRRNGWHRQLAKLPVEREWLAANGSLF